MVKLKPLVNRFFLVVEQKIWKEKTVRPKTIAQLYGKLEIVCNIDIRENSVYSGMIRLLVSVIIIISNNHSKNNSVNHNKILAINTA